MRSALSGNQGVVSRGTASHFTCGAANVPVKFRAMLVNVTDQGHLDRLQRLLEHCKSLRKDNLTSPLRVDLSGGRISLLHAPGTKHIEVIILCLVLMEVTHFTGLILCVFFEGISQ